MNWAVGRATPFEQRAEYTAAEPTRFAPKASRPYKSIWRLWLLRAECRWQARLGTCACPCHLAAGDLLRRIGDDEAALTEYRLAAERLVGLGQYLQAGELMADRAGRPELATGYWRDGWDRRPSGGDAVACGLRLATEFADRATPRELLSLAAEARDCFDQAGADWAAVQFYNGLVTLADRPALTSIRADLRDRVLIGLAVKLRQRVASQAAAGSVVSDWLGQSGVWPATVVSDVQFAVKARVKNPRREVQPASPGRVRLRPPCCFSTPMRFGAAPSFNLRQCLAPCSLAGRHGCSGILRKPARYPGCNTAGNWSWRASRNKGRRTGRVCTATRAASS